MKKKRTNINNHLLYNEAVLKTYFKLLEHALTFISTLEEEPLRQIMVRKNDQNIEAGIIIHELLNALIYLRLECYEGDILGIHYGYEQSDRLTKYYPITSAFIRSIYRHSSKENTEINIEDCIRTDWVINNCAELFEYIGDRNKHHEIKTLDYNPRTKKHSLKVA